MANHWRLISIFNSHSSPKINKKLSWISFIFVHCFYLYHMCSIHAINIFLCGCCFSIHFLIINELIIIFVRLMVLPFKLLQFWFRECRRACFCMEFYLLIISSGTPHTKPTIFFSITKSFNSHFFKVKLQIVCLI